MGRKRNNPVVAVAGAMGERDVDGHARRVTRSFHTANGAAVVRPFAFLRTGGAPRAAKNVSEIPLPTWFILVCSRSRYSCRPAAMMVFDAGVRELGSRAPRAGVRLDAGTFRRRAGDGVHRLARPHDAVLDGAREFLLEQQELDDPIGRDASVALPIHLERAGRAQHGGPLDVVGRRADIGCRWQQQKVLHVEDAGRLVGALQHASEPAEVPALVVGHRGVGHAREEMAGHPDRREQILRIGLAFGIAAELTIR